MIQETSNKKRVLVIEDDPPTLNIIIDKLKLEGLDVLRAIDGEEGLVIATKEQPDLIILDVLMPRMDGVEMMRKIRQDGDWGKNVPMIILTNLDRDQIGMTEILNECKPIFLEKTAWSISQIVEKVKNALKE